MVTNLITKERYSLGQGDFSLVFDDDGMECTVVGITTAGDEKSIDIREALRYSVYYNKDREYFIKDSASSISTLPKSLEQGAVGHTTAKLALRMGGSEAVWEFDIAVVCARALPMHGCTGRATLSSRCWASSRTSTLRVQKSFATVG